MEIKIKNKWINQRIQKKQNKIQYASKHYGTDENEIIFKRKDPVKQRKDRKKFKTQRSRKKVQKQMAFDYNDFMFKNKNEVNISKRIQIRPTIQYQHGSKHKENLTSLYNSYFNPSNDKFDRITTKTVYTNIVYQNEYKFSHNVSELLSLKPDQYLGSKMVVTYWKNRHIEFIGELTCISHTGFIRLQNIVYNDYRDLPQKFANSYWFHYKCIGNILLISDANKYINITKTLMDLLKLKVMQWLQTQKRTANCIHQIKQNPIRRVSDISECFYMDRICKLLWREQKKINYFVLLLKKYPFVQKAEILKFNKCEIAKIIYQYIQIVNVSGVSSKELKAEMGNGSKSNCTKNNYVDWDTEQVATLTKRRNYRTV